jgi:diguanylate cyclase (GGDEF)-like protein/PAS domain S-box-containing protein
MLTPVMPTAESREIESECALLETERELFFERSPQPMFIHDRDTLQFLNVNDAALKLYIYTREEFLALKLSDIRASAQVPDILQRQKQPTGYMHYRGPRTHYRKSGEAIEVDVFAQDIVYLNRRARVTLIVDISERKRAEEAARLRAEQKVARLTRMDEVRSGINSAIVRIRDRTELYAEVCNIAVTQGGFKLAWVGVVDRSTLDGRPVAWAGAEQGYIDKIRLTIRTGAPGSDRPACRAMREKVPVISNDIEADPTMAGVRSDAMGRGYRAVAAVPILLGPDPACVLVLYAEQRGFFDEEEMRLLTSVATDLSFALEHIAKEERINYLAYYDVVTALPNRTLFAERINHSVRSGAHDRMAVIMLDLERLAIINDTLGRRAGDVLLRQIADRLLSAVGELGEVARVGGDSFAISSSVAKPGDATRFLEQEILSVLGRPFSVEDEELRLSFKSGIAVFPENGDDAETLIRHAETALTTAKQSGDRFLFYASHMNERVAEVLSLENKLRIAIVDEQFVLHFQPIVDLMTNELIALEALIRWESPELGLVPPLKFIPLLEETGLILEVGRWVLQEVADQQRRWRTAGYKPPRVAVNISAIQLRQKGFVDEVLKLIVADQENPAEIDLEIAESVIMEDVERNIPKLRIIRNMGVGVAIDDFGSGYSSLSYIAKLPVTALKIDRTFVNDLVTGEDSVMVVSTIISLARSLNFSVTAEGVETKEQRDLLKMLKCHYMQGYIVSRPLAAAQVQPLFITQ